MMRPGTWFLREQATGLASSCYYQHKTDAEAAQGHSEGLRVEDDWVIAAWPMDVDRRLGARRRPPRDYFWELNYRAQLERLMAECATFGRAWGW